MKNSMWDFCPECGSSQFITDENFSKNHRQCSNRACLQEYFTDIDYTDCVKSNLKNIFKFSAQLLSQDIMIIRLESAIRSCVGFEPFNSLEPRKLSEALEELKEWKEATK